MIFLKKIEPIVVMLFFKVIGPVFDGQGKGIIGRKNIRREACCGGH